MQFNIKSSTKNNKKGLVFSLALISLALLFSLFFDLKGHSQNPPKQFGKDQDPELEHLIQRTEQYIGLSPDSAEILAEKALHQAFILKKQNYVLRSYNVLGNIKTLKGQLSDAMDNYQKAAQLAEKLQNEKEKCKALLNIGQIHYSKGNFDKALSFFSGADSIAMKERFETLESYALYYIGKFHHTKGNFSQARFFYDKSITISRKNKDLRQLANILPSLGKQYIAEGELNKALITYQECYNISLQLKDQLLNADICNHLGGLYLELKEYEKAMLYHRKALRYRINMNYPGELAKSYNNIGRIYLGLRELDSAKYYFTESLVLCKKTDYKKGYVKTLINLGDVYRLLNNPAKAENYLTEAFKTSVALGYDNGIAESGLELGELYSDVSRTDSAIRFYQLALDKLTKTNYNEDLLRVYTGLYKIFEKKKDHEKALLYHIALLETEKKVLDVENKRQLAILNITFDTERKEKDFKVLLKDNELKASLLKSKNTFIWLIIAALCSMILLCLYLNNRFYSKKKANKKLEKLNSAISDKNKELASLNKELETVNKEKDKLFSIISHELRNPLYWLQNLAEVLSVRHQSMSPEKIQKTLSSMDESAKNVYHLMDNLLYWSRTQLNRVHPKKSQHNLSTLVSDTVRMYESFLQQKEIICYLRFPKDIFIQADADLFSCVIRNLLSNAIKYTPAGGEIVFDCKLMPSEVLVTISDTGKGMNSEELSSVFTFNNSSMSMPGLMQEKGSGLGLRLCKDFVEMNGGKIWADSALEVGTRFFFTVPLSEIQAFKPKEESKLKEINFL